MADPYTQTAEDPTQRSGLLRILEQIQALQTRPLIPDNPLSQLGSALQGASAGFAGQPNPALVQAMQERQQALSGLTQTAAVLGQLGQMRHQQATLEETRRGRTLREQTEARQARQGATSEELQRKTLTAKIGKDLMALGDPLSVRKGLEAYNAAGDLGLSAGELDAIAQSGRAKDLPAQLALALNAMKAGLDPATIGVKLPPATLQMLQRLTPEQQAELLGPDAKLKAAELATKTIEAEAQAIRLRNIKAGLPSEGVPKKGDDYIAWLAYRSYSDPRWVPTPRERQLIDIYNLRNSLSGVTSDAQLALRAVAGDVMAERALAKLQSSQRNATDTDLLFKAAQVETKIRANPQYAPTLNEQATVLAADRIAERRQGKPLPPTVEKTIGSARGILDLLKQITPLIESGKAEAFLGPVAGRWGKFAEKAPSGLGLSDPDRAKLQTLLAMLFAEVGPEKFGGQFTGPEQALIRDFLAEVSNPGALFQVRFRVFTDLMEKKYRGLIQAAEANKYRIPDEWRESPLSGAGATEEDPRRALIRELAAKGWTNEQIKAALRARGY